MSNENTAAEEAVAVEETPEAVAVEEVVEEVAEANPAVEELSNDLKRLQAEYVNYRARVERDRHLAAQVAREKFVSSLMPVLDDISASRAAGDLTEGPFASIATKLEHVLSQQGVVRISEVGAEFDPMVHEAMTRAPHPEIPEDHVSMIISDGYMVGERLVRAARVVVSAGS